MVGVEFNAPHAIKDSEFPRLEEVHTMTSWEAIIIFDKFITN